MNKISTAASDCPICNILIADEDVIVFETDYWRVALSADQLYLGRAYVTLLRHCPSLSELTSAELDDWHDVVRLYEERVRQTFRASLFNWGCLMNDAYKAAQPKPHVHWHVRPRYENAPILHGVEYPDPNFGHHYIRDRINMVSRDILNEISSCLAK